MKTTSIPSDAFKSAMELAADEVNKKPLKSVATEMAKPGPITPPTKASKVVEEKKIKVEPTFVLPIDEDQVPKMVHEFAEKYDLVVTDKESGKKAVRCEVWQFLLELMNVLPSFESEYCEAGVITTCTLYTAQGKIVSRSSTIASNTESFLKDKPAYAVWGMSQTRALARAAKNVYGYIMVQAGYSAVPSDELSFDDDMPSAPSEGAVKVSSEDEIARLAGRK